MQEKIEQWKLELGLKNLFLTEKNLNSLFSLIKEIKEKETVEHYQDHLFEAASTPGFGLNGNREQAIGLMKEVALKNLEYIEVEKGVKFIIRDKISGKEIVCSDRPSEHNEIRGLFLRNLLDQQDQDQTLYDAVQNIISTRNITLTYYVSSYEDCPSFIPLVKEIIKGLMERYEQNPNLSDEEMRGIAADLFDELFEKEMIRYKQDKEHSEIYKQVIDGERKLKIDSFIGILNDQMQKNEVYELIKLILREHIDDQSDIFSGWVEGNWLRHTAFSHELEPKSQHSIQADNTILRCAARVQAVDALFAQKYAKEPDIYANKSRQLKDEFVQLVEKVLDEHQKTNILELEKEFNTVLLRHLHDAHLTEGCTRASDAEKLLLKICSRKQEPIVTFYGDDLKKKTAQYPYKDQVNLNNKVGFVDFLKSPSTAIKTLREEFDENLNAYEQSVIEFEPGLNTNAGIFKSKAKQLLFDIRKLDAAGADNQELAQLNAALYYGRNALQNPTDLNNIQQVADLSQRISSKKNAALFDDLKTTLLLLCCAALVMIGILAAIPTGGTSLLFTSVGVAIAATLGGAMTGFTAGTGLAIAEEAFRPPHPDLSHSLFGFKKALNEVKPEEPGETNQPSEPQP